MCLSWSFLALALGPRKKRRRETMTRHTMRWSIREALEQPFVLLERIGRHIEETEEQRQGRSQPDGKRIVDRIESLPIPRCSRRMTLQFVSEGGYTGKSLCALSFAPALSPATCNPRARYGPITGMLYANPAIVWRYQLAKSDDYPRSS
jgi:hypothetical protein